MMPDKFTWPMLLPVAALLLLVLVALLVGRSSALGNDRFATLQFWSLFAPAFGMACFLGFFLGIMATDSPALTNPTLVAFGMGCAIFFVFALCGLLLGYYLTVPTNLLLRAAIGFIGLPVAFSTGLPLLALPLAPFVWLYTYRRKKRLASDR